MNAFPSRLSSLYSGLGQHNMLGGTSQALAYPAAPMWIAVRQRFAQFHDNISLTLLQRIDGFKKHAGVVNCLNRYYYDLASETENSFYIGSWGKDTAIRPPRDVDLYFLLPPSVYYRFERHLWNKQSALLQEVKSVLIKTYPDTQMSGDGQIVLVRFGSYSVEVVPAFSLQNGGYWICNTNNGGTYKRTNPWEEFAYIEAVDKANNRNLRPLIRMLKAWQMNCSVPLKSFQLELLAADFLQQSPWRQNDFFYFDWICRDFFAYLYFRANTFVTVPDTLERIFLGEEWQSRCESAYRRAFRACENEKINCVEAAGEEWQKIFGLLIPRSV